MKNNIGVKEITGESLERNKEGKVAGIIRIAVVVVVLLLVYQVDNSAFLGQLSKWPRRAVLLLAILGLIQMISYIAINVWVKYFRINITGKKI